MTNKTSLGLTSISQLISILGRGTNNFTSCSLFDEHILYLCLFSSTVSLSYRIFSCNTSSVNRSRRLKKMKQRDASNSFLPFIPRKGSKNRSKHQFAFFSHTALSLPVFFFVQFPDASSSPSFRGHVLTLFAPSSSFSIFFSISLLSTA